MNNRMNLAPCGYLLLSKQGIIKEVNQTFLNMFQYEYEEVIGKHIEMLLNLANKFIFHTYFFPQLQTNGSAEELYISFKAKNGDNIPVLLNGSYSEIDGEVLIDCIVVKISKRINYEQELQDIKKQLEDALKMKDEVLEQQTRQKELLETTLFSINEGIIVTDAVGKITLMNNLAEKYTAWSVEEAFGVELSTVFSILNMKTGEIGINPIHYPLQTGENYDFDENIQLLPKEGEERYISGTAAAISRDNGDVTGMVVSFKDITKEYIQEREIKGFLNVNLDMLCVADVDGYIHKVNKKFEDILGYTKEELEGRNYISLVHEEDIEITMKAIQDLIDQETVLGFTNRFRCKDGSYKYIEWHTEPNGKYTYSSARDVTEKWMREAELNQSNNQLMQMTEEMKVKNQKLEALAVTDELTGAYNRHFFEDKTVEVIETSNSNSTPISMVIMDLDHFKRVNDTWGHPVGDEVLKQAAKVAQKMIRKSDFLVRLGGEEFVILMPETNGMKAFHFAEKIRQGLEQNHIPIVGQVTGSFGVAEKIKGESLQTWYKRMDEALYQAKETGRNRVVIAIE